MTENTSFLIEPNENVKIWRYMDFTKFVSLVTRQELFFSTVALLRNIDDQEGTINSATLNNPVNQEMRNHIERMGLFRQFNNYVAINCWHMNETESTAMWEIYSRGNPSVTIQSSFGSLKTSLNAHSKSELSFGMVHYLDEDEPVPEPTGINALNYVLWKRKGYSHENELRAIHVATSELYYQYQGIYLPVDLNTLIEKIIISPRASKWFSELVEKICFDYNLKGKLVRSSLENYQSSDLTMNMELQVDCVNCGATNYISTPPHIVRDNSDRSQTMYIANRSAIICKDCGTRLSFDYQININS